MKTMAEEFRLAVFQIMVRACSCLDALKDETGDVDSSDENKEAMLAVLACILAEFAELATPNQMQDTYGTPGSKLS